MAVYAQLHALKFSATGFERRAHKSLAEPCSTIFGCEQHTQRSVVHLRRNTRRRHGNDIAQADDSIAVNRNKMWVARR